MLDLSLIDANSGFGGDQGISYIGGAAFSNTAGELQYIAALGILSGDTNGDGVQDFVVEFLNFKALTAGDLVL